MPATKWMGIGAEGLFSCIFIWIMSNRVMDTVFLAPYISFTTQLAEFDSDFTLDSDDLSSLNNSQNNHAAR